MTSIIEIYRRFPTQEDCLTHLEKVRWKGEPKCVFCKADTVCKKAEANQRPRSLIRSAASWVLLLSLFAFIGVLLAC